MDIAERRLPQDGRINLKDGTRDIDVRVSTIPTVHGESISLRLLARDEQRFGLDRLDMSEHHLALVKSLLAQPNGIMLLTGPTGSGKSTSLYCFLSSINSVQRRIITIEDPVEYRLPGVSQIEVRPEINLTFANGLRSILRQDPNVVMVGEMRDFETAEIGIRAAMTGHLVFSTLHTNDAVGAITRLLDMGVEPFLVASVVRAFIAQRLVRTICQQCVADHEYDPAYLESIGMPREFGHRFKRGEGCEILPAHRLPGPHGHLRDLSRDRAAARGDRAQGQRRRAQGGRGGGGDGFAAPGRLAARWLGHDHRRGSHPRDAGRRGHRGDRLSPRQRARETRSSKFETRSKFRKFRSSQRWNATSGRVGKRVGMSVLARPKLNGRNVLSASTLGSPATFLLNSSDNRGRSSLPMIQFR